MLAILLFAKAGRTSKDPERRGAIRGSHDARPRVMRRVSQLDAVSEVGALAVGQPLCDRLGVAHQHEPTPRRAAVSLTVRWPVTGLGLC